MSDTTKIKRGDNSKSRQQQPTASIPFPWKLHRILDDADAKGFNDVVSWVPSQNGFKVYKTKTFDEDIMPKYFDKTKYKSFQRQLNMWGFDRVGSGPYKGAYLHPCFLRGQPQLCESMQRTKIKGIHSKKLRKKNGDPLGGGSNHSLGGSTHSHSLGGGSSHLLGGSSSHLLGGSSSHSHALRGGSSHYDPLGGGSNHSLGRGSTHSTGSSTPTSSNIDVHASIQAVAQNLADLERQKEEIQRKLELVSGNSSTMTPMSSSHRMITPDGSLHSRGQQQNEYSSSSSSEDDLFQPLPLNQGDSLLFGGRNFFFVEDGKISSSQPTNSPRRRTARRYSLELQTPDSDQYILKELDEDFCGDELGGESNHSKAKGMLSPTPLAPDLDVVMATTNIAHRNSSLIIGLDKPKRRFSFLNTAVQNPLEEPYEIQPKPYRVSRSSAMMAALSSELKLSSSFKNNMMNMNMMTNNMMNMRMNTNNMDSHNNPYLNDRTNSLCNLINIQSRPSFTNSV